MPPQPAPTSSRVVLIHPLAPPAPGFGQPCNGCGLCCLMEPCPVGIAVTRRRTGPCEALIWGSEAAAYRCGVLSAPGQFVPWLPARLVQRLARRWIAAGAGCDARLERLDAPL